MSRYDDRGGSRSTRIFVGGLPYDVREREVEDIFYKVRSAFSSLFPLMNTWREVVSPLMHPIRSPHHGIEPVGFGRSGLGRGRLSPAPRPAPTQYGRIRDIAIKGPRDGPAFAFVEFDDSRDAEDAVRSRRPLGF